MQPRYYKLLGFDRERTAFAGKYGLLLFRDQYDYRLQVQPLGIPALFIPGNAGSAKQMRSIAKEASKYYYEKLAEEQRSDGKILSRPIDFFTLDFNEEFSALHGHSLLEQAQFLNDAIAYILSLYDDDRHQDPNLPKPTSVLLVGHSMGGVVARTLFTMSNYRPGTVHAVLTAATPHLLPPVTLDFEISDIYDRIESFWSRGFQGPDAPLKNVSLVSIAGGNLDIIVNGESGNIHNIVPQSHGFTVFTSSIPHAWVGSDHVSILWCNQIAIVLGKTLIDVVDASYPEQVKPLEERMRIFRNRLLTGLEDHLDNPKRPKETKTFVLSEVAHTIVTAGSVLQYPPRVSGKYDVELDALHLHIMPVPWDSDVDTFNLLTDHQFGPDSRLDLLLCTDEYSEVRAAASTDAARLTCRYDTLSAIPIPASLASPAHPSTSPPLGKYGRGQEFRFVSQKVQELDGVQYLVILDKGRKFPVPGFLIAEFFNSYLILPTIHKPTVLELLNDGLRIHAFPVRPSLVSTLRLPNIDNSLLTYTLTVSRQGCYAPQHFSPMLRQSGWTMYEDRYSVDVTSKQDGIDVNFHGDLPYYERVQLPGKKGIEFRFWMDPSCPVPLSLNLQVDKYGSLGKVVIRYRMVVLVFTFLVVILTLRAQFKAFNDGHPFIPFGIMLTQLITTTFLKFTLFLAAIALLQSFQAKTTESWFSSFRFRDALLGANDTFFWFLAPLFFQIAIGIVIVIWIALNGLVRSIAASLMFVSRRYNVSKAIGNMLMKRSRAIRRRVITTIILFIMVATFVPYQFAFVVAVLVHIVSCVRSLIYALKATSSQTQAAWDRYHYVMSIFVMFFLLLPCTLPVLMVWIRNLSVQWYEPFSSDHRLDYIAPFIFFVEAVTDGAMVPRTPEKG
ncbi:PGAP1-like protein-domain-containing protein [Lobosporangium transversale]|uniref:GPI inositol-deacylase n=1 Tax=Lobosporangium transversale TaxID=64571 RepID=A0A1Y2GNZ5_9FUNG|nr:PGAP1-like protein-domain-containing protein [Lobosporangium transversale]ORZ15985.1 PGAP1-like protein-domain-containing protein [Lobosporangium transversale]|eukprot:XP_021881332.1 PGAP1-like protein-domain-containing protein [Lobosporangium transversale]